MKRYDFSVAAVPAYEYCENPEGEWVRYEDIKHLTSEPIDELGDQIYALLVLRGYGQLEAHAIASGPGSI